MHLYSPHMILTAITDGTQTLNPNDYLSEPVPGSAAAAYGHPLTEEDDPYLRPPYGPYKRPGHGGRRNKRDRRAMITHLLRLLLEPTSPVESDDETERAISARCVVVVPLCTVYHYVLYMLPYGYTVSV